MNKNEDTLHGTVEEYEAPTEPVSETDWAVLHSQPEYDEIQKKLFQYTRN